MSWRTKRIVATTLLLYALVDLTVPGLCHGDDTIPSQPVSTQITQQQAGNKDGNAPVSSPAVDQEDCFCCCSNVMPSVATVVAAPIDVAIANLFPSPVYFRLLADPFFHPPRD